MLKKGINNKRSKEGENRYLLTGKDITRSLLRRKYMKHKRRTITVIVIIRGIVEIGLEIPYGGYRKLINAPVNIKKARLSPTE